MTATMTRVPDTASDLLVELAAVPAGDPRRAALRDRAIEAWLPLARHLAGRYAGRGESADDLVQTATIGLIKAVDRFDPDRGVDFAGYAIPTILGEVKRHFRDRGWSIRVPRRIQELHLAITRATERLTSTLGHSPTVADLAADLKVSEDEILEGLEGSRAYTAASLSAPVGAEGSAELGDTLGGEDHDMQVAELRIALGPALAMLGAREQKILSLRFYGNLTQSEIAEQMGLSQMHVSRLIARSLLRLRAHLSDG